MSETAIATPTAAPTELPSIVVVLDVPPVDAKSGFRSRLPIVLIVLALPVWITGVTLGIFSVAKVGRASTGSAMLSIGLGIAALFVTIIGLFLWGVFARRRASRKQWSEFQERDGHKAFADQVANCLRKPDFLADRNPTTALGKANLSKAQAAASALRAAYPARVAFVAPSAAAKLATFPAPPGLLEPEEIGHTFTAQQLFALIVPLYFCAKATFSMIRSDSLSYLWAIVCGISFLVLAAMALSWFTSVLGERFAALKTTRGLVRAGPGWVDDRSGRRWTVEDSVMIIRAVSHAKKARYQAILLGPKGAITIPVGRCDGTAFINLWQRWTTPLPRLDLAGEPNPALGFKRGWRKSRQSC